MKRRFSHLVFLLGLVFTSGYAQAVESTFAVAKKMANTFNRYETYESYWKAVKVKDTAAYETLSLFLRRHGKDILPSSAASGNVVYFFSVQDGKAQQSQITVVQTNPLVLSIEGKSYTIKNIADAIALLEIEPSKQSYSILQWILGQEAFAAAATKAADAVPAKAPAAAVPAAAPAALAAISTLVPLPAGSRYQDLKLDYKEKITGNAIAQALYFRTNTPLSCKAYLDDPKLISEIPGMGSGTMKLKYKSKDSVETVTFPNYKGATTLQYRRTKAQSAQGLPDDEIWYTCDSVDCKSPKEFNKEKELGEASLEAVAASKAKNEALAKYNELHKSYKEAAKDFNKDKQAKILSGSLLELAESKRYPKTTPVSQIVSDLVGSDAWATIKESLKVMVKGSRSTLKEKDTLVPDQVYNDTLLKKYMTCSIYLRFQEEDLFAKECEDEAANITQFQDAADVRKVNEIIDSRAKVLRPLTPPAKSTKTVPRPRNISRQDLYFLSKADSDIYEKPLEPSFKLASLCRRFERLASGMGEVPEKISNELTSACLFPASYLDYADEKLKSMITLQAPIKALKAFELGPQAAANFASVIGQCCQSTPCADGIKSGTLLREGTFAPSTSRPPATKKDPAKGR